MVARPQAPADAREARFDLEQAGVIQRDSPVPYYFQLCTFIETRIKRKELRPGQLLPSEQEFCDVLGISRTVVRQAMAELSRKGFVTKQNGKRSIISQPKHETGLMQTMEGFHEDAIARGQKPTTRVLKFKVIEADAEVAQALNIADNEPVIMLYRLRFLDDVPEVLVVSYLPEKLCPGCCLKTYRANHFTRHLRANLASASGADTAPSKPSHSIEPMPGCLACEQAVRRCC